MTAQELAQSAKSDTDPPPNLPKTLEALWRAKAGQWEAAHDLTNDIPDPEGAWIHAYLHREEGDLGNAAYWYSRANQPTPAASVSLDEEWQNITQALIS